MGIKLTTNKLKNKRHTQNIKPPILLWETELKNK